MTVIMTFILIGVVLYAIESINVMLDDEDDS